jgi:hypothetical protein
MIWVGGVMIYAGFKKTNPLKVLQAVLQNQPIPANTTGQKVPTGTGTPNPTTPGGTSGRNTTTQ